MEMHTVVVVALNIQAIRHQQCGITVVDNLNALHVIVTHNKIINIEQITNQSLFLFMLIMYQFYQPLIFSFQFTTISICKQRIFIYITIFNNQQKIMNRQENKHLKRKQRHFHSQIPKGSYHNYCRNRLQQQQQQFLTRINNTRINSRNFQTHQTYRSTYTPKPTPLQSALSFQQYLEEIQHPDRQKQQSQRPNTTNLIGKKNKQQNQRNIKIENQQIIDSHLPFFKCKLEKTQFLIRKPDFRVKENKFKMNRNIVENNCFIFLGQSLPLRQF